jgi:hypothetical protein
MITEHDSALTRKEIRIGMVGANAKASWAKVANDRHGKACRESRPRFLLYWWIIPQHTDEGNHPTATPGS